MVDKPPSRPRGVVRVPRELLQRDERETREEHALAQIEARLASGTISAEEADREILERVLEERFAFLPPDALEELRAAGLELLEEPEIVETRAYVGREPGDEP